MVEIDLFNDKESYEELTEELRTISNTYGCLSPMQRRQIEEVKNKIKDKYLNKDGIHTIGIRSDKNAITIFSEYGLNGELMNKIREEVKPYDIIIKKKEKQCLKG